MAISLVASTVVAPGGAGGTTSAIDTTGATLLVISLAGFSGGVVATVTDNKGNTWIPTTPRQVGNALHRFYFALPAIVGTGHTFTVTGTTINAAIRVSAWAGVVSYQAERGLTGTASPLASGSITPLVNGSLVLSALGSETAATDTIPSGFTLVGTTPYVGGNNMQESQAYLIQTTAAAINPQWSWSGSHAAAITNTLVFNDNPVSGSPNSAKWRLNVSAMDPAGPSLFVIAEITMASVVAGADLCNSGFAAAQSEHSAGFDAAKAFDNNASTGWATGFVTFGWIHYEFPAPVSIVYYTVQQLPTFSAPRDWTFEYWNGIAWVIVDTRTGQTGWTSGQIRPFTLPTPPVTESVQFLIV